MIITLFGNLMYLLVYSQVLHIGSLYNRKEIKVKCKHEKENKVKELLSLGAAVRGRLGKGAGTF